MTETYGLTKRQHDALDIIEEYIERERQSPSFEDIKNALGIASKSSVVRLVRALKDRGMIDFLPHRARSIVVLVSDPAPAKPACPAPVSKDAAATWVALPQHLYARLARFCVERDEKIDAVLADAVELHLDDLGVRVTADVTGGGCG